MIVENYWKGIARRLQVESGVINALIPHSGEKGVSNELSLARVIENLVPPSIGVGTGVIFDSVGNVSAQTDIILYERTMQPQLMAQTNQVMFPVETVRLAIEVKTRLTASDIEVDFPTKKEKLAALRPISGRSIPLFGLFAYSFADSNYNRAKEMDALEADQAPDIACVIDPGYVLLSAAERGFVPLRNPGDTGEGDTSWLQPPKGAATAFVPVDGIEYPVFMLGAYTGEKFVGDPGRALLNFCLEMLSILDTHGDFDWVSSYASESLRGVLPVS